MCARALAFVFLPAKPWNVYASFVSISMQIFPFFRYLIIFIFLGNWNFLLLIGNRTSCCPIQSVIILVINKSDSRFAVVRFCLSLAWLQTELDSTQSSYHYKFWAELTTTHWNRRTWQWAILSMRCVCKEPRLLYSLLWTEYCLNKYSYHDSRIK